MCDSIVLSLIYTSHSMYVQGFLQLTAVQIFSLLLVHAFVQEIIFTFFSDVSLRSLVSLTTRFMNSTDVFRTALRFLHKLRFIASVLESFTEY